MNYTYNIKEISVIAVVLTFLFYCYHVVTRNKAEKASADGKKAE